MPTFRSVLAGFGLATTLLVSASSCSSQPHTETCAASRAAMLDMPLRDFDQGPEGWRSVHDSIACPGEAAQVLAAYRKRHQRTLTPADKGLLLWHEAQVRALDGDVEAAIPLFEQSGSPGEADWNRLYRQATLAFLGSNRPALERARSDLAALGRADRPAPNLDVVDGLIQCFGRPYRTAYACRAPNTENGMTFYALPPED